MTLSESQALLRRIEQVISNTRPADGMLDLLAALTSVPSGLTFPIGLISGSAIIRGGLVAPSFFAERLDGAIETVLGALDQDARETLRPVLAGVFQTSAEAQQERERKAAAQLEKYDEVPTFWSVDADDAESLATATTPGYSLDLRDARISVSGELLEVGALRVEMKAISAWWPLTDEHGVNLNFVDSTSSSME